ncbi:MAG: alanine racemase [Acidobacteriaceae bacterium]|nr:alanine racemase [Acidobacteriaceae bacterium]MBV9295568.1 alanine racemase [Acidobacteriaceae bacterium]MBV9763995.1 alanine racemase [Acidobacteriaceae bacterium]
MPYRSWVEVSRSQIAANFQAIRDVVGPAVEVMPVVKADAYRHGAIEVSRTLEQQGARWLAVSNTEEGVALRDAGIQARILVMADFLPFTREAMLAYNLTPVIHSLEDLRELHRLAVARGERCRYHLKIDTGMGRLGVCSDAASLGEAILSAKHIELEGLMTHFASAANYQTTQTDDQIALFDKLAHGLNEAGIHPQLVHLSSTIPVAYGRRQAWRGMIRPGHAIYGYVSPARGHAPAKILQVKPALTWRATILSVKQVPAGSLIGYGGIFRAPRPMRVAVLAAGYADGIPHRLSNRGSVIVNGRFAPILGAVSMDLTSIDLTNSPETVAGDAVTLLGSEGDVSLDAQQIAKLAGTISYSVLCGIHARVKRVYV